MAAATPDPTRRSDRARQAILAATRERLTAVGFDRLTVEGIAAAAGVGKQTIYRWWPSKGAVVFDALLAASAQDGEPPPLPDTGAIADDLQALMRAVVRALTDPEADAMQRTVTAEIQRDETLARELVDRLLAPQMRAVAARLAGARDVGQLRADLDPELAAEQLMGPVFHRWLLRTAPLGDAFADALVRQTLAGLAATP